MRTRTEQLGRSRHRQRGAVLGVALLLLAVLTALAVVTSQLTRSRGISISTTQERDVAFQAAEAALKAAERLTLSGQSLEACIAARCRVYSAGVADASNAYALDWWYEHAWQYTTSTAWVPAARSGATGNSMFVVEKLADISDSMTTSPTGAPSGQTFYRATALAHSSGAAPVILQSTFARRFD